MITLSPGLPSFKSATACFFSVFIIYMEFFSLHAVAPFDKFNHSESHNIQFVMQLKLGSMLSVSLPGRWCCCKEIWEPLLASLNPLSVHRDKLHFFGFLSLKAHSPLLFFCSIFHVFGCPQLHPPIAPA